MTEEEHRARGRGIRPTTIREVKAGDCETPGVLQTIMNNNANCLGQPSVLPAERSQNDRPLFKRSCEMEGNGRRTKSSFATPTERTPLTTFLSRLFFPSGKASQFSSSSAPANTVSMLRVTSLARLCLHSPAFAEPDLLREQILLARNKALS